MRTFAMLFAGLMVLGDFSARLPAVPLLDDPGAVVPLCIPGGVADRAGKIGFVTEPDGDIVALDLDSGKVLWRTTRGGLGKPLLVHGNRLFVQTAGPKEHQLRIVALDVAARGKQIWEAQPISLPVPVSVRRDHWKCTTWARLVRGRLLFSWQGPAAFEEAALPIRCGTWQIDCRDGEYTAVAWCPPVQAAALPAAASQIAGRMGWWQTDYPCQVMGKVAYGVALRPTNRHPDFIMESENMLQAVDIESAKLLWQQPIEREIKVLQW